MARIKEEKQGCLEVLDLLVVVLLARREDLPSMSATRELAWSCHKKKKSL
jgi:hypothetical protein